MNSELIVDVSAKEISMALLEDQRLVELQRERRDLAFAVGDIYLGRVKKVMPGLNAAFVDVGYKKDAFLHYLDLGMIYQAQQRFLEQIEKTKAVPSLSKIPTFPDLPKDGKIADYLKAGQNVLVQVVKEPISTKGPRLSAEISIAGRNLVLVPFSDKVSVSAKIESHEERARLKQLILSMKPKNFSVIIRTSAEGKRASELDQELSRLLRRWEESIQKLPKITKTPKIVYEESSRALGILRDTFNPSFQSIHVNDKAYYEEIREYVRQIAPGRTVTCKSGAYLIIEQTEAMYVVDVNSGNRSRKSTEQEGTAIDVNLIAAEELARQLRLRDMGGIIVVDFIDMPDQKNRQLLYEHMVKLMESDRTRHNILPLSKFGVMQITRQRVRPATQINTDETCPTCLGTGKMKSSILFTDQLEEKLRDLAPRLDTSYINVHVHPYVAAYLTKGFFMSIARRWKLQIARGIRVTPNQSLGFLDYKFVDKEGNEIEALEE